MTRFLRPLPDTLEHVGKLDALPQGSRESAAHQMLLEAELFDCKERCTELFRVAHTLDPAELIEIDSVLDGYRPEVARGLNGFWQRLVLLRQRLAEKGNSGARSRTISRDFEILTVFRTARALGASYEAALQVAVGEFRLGTVKTVEAALTRARAHPHNPYAT